MYVVHIDLKSESGSEFVYMVTVYLSILWSSYLRFGKQVAKN